MKLAIDSLDTRRATSLSELQSPLNRFTRATKSVLVQVVNTLLVFMQNYARNTGGGYDFIDRADVISDLRIQKHYPKHLWKRHSALLTEAKKLQVEKDVTKLDEFGVLTRL